jgi:hypothetical protein
MGAIFVTLFLSAAVLQSPPPDSLPTFSSPAIHQLVERALARRWLCDSTVNDYQATIRYRVSGGLGRRAWS